MAPNDMTVVMRFQAEAGALKADLAALKTSLKEIASTVDGAAAPSRALAEHLTSVGAAVIQGGEAAAQGLQDAGQGATQAASPVAQLVRQIEDVVVVAAAAGNAGASGGAVMEQGLQAAGRGAHQATSAVEGLVRQVDALESASSVASRTPVILPTASADIARAAAGFAEVEAALSPVARATQQYERARAAVTAAEQAGAVSGERVAIVLRQLEQHYDQLIASARAAEDGSDAQARAAAEAQRAYSALVAVIDPVTRAQQEMAAAQDVVTAAVGRGVITQQEAGRTLALLAQRQTEFAGTTGVAGHAVGNLLAQLNDVGLMWASGQNPLMTAIQQGPQISQALGGAGAAGAVRTLGAAFVGLLSPLNLLPIAVIAFGGTVVSWLMDIGAGTASVEDQVQALADAMTRLGTAQRDASMGGSDLVARYGAAADRARDLLAIERQIAETRAQQAFTTAARTASAEVFQGGDAAHVLTGSGADELQRLAETMRVAQAEYVRLQREVEAFGDIRSTADQQAWDALQARRASNDAVMRQTYEYRVAVESVARAYGVSTDAAARLAVAAARVREAEDAPARLAAAEALAKAIYESTDGLRGASSETATLYDRLLEAVRAGLDLEAIDIASGLNVARGAASGLADELARAAGEARSLAAAGIDSVEESRIRLQYRGDPVAEARALAEARFNAQVEAPVGVADKEFRDEIAEQKRTYVESAVETEQNRQALLEWQRQQSVSASGASGAGRTGSSAGNGVEARASLSELRAEVQELLGDLDLQAAQIAEKVRLGLMTSAEGAEALDQARRGTADGIAELIPQMEAQNQKAGPEAVAAIEQARLAVRGLAGDWAKAGQSMGDVGKTLAGSFSDAFGGFLAGASSAEDAMQSLENTVTSAIARMFSEQLNTRIFTPIFSPIFDGIFGGPLFAKGGVPDAPGLEAHSGKVLTQPTPFRMADGRMGVAGEADPEAILPMQSGGVRAVTPEGGETTLPLTRSASGHLAVRLGIAVPEGEQTRASRLQSMAAELGLVNNPLAPLAIATDRDAVPPVGSELQSPSVSTAAGQTALSPVMATGGSVPVAPMVAGSTSAPARVSGPMLGADPVHVASDRPNPAVTSGIIPPKRLAAFMVDVAALQTPSPVMGTDGPRSVASLPGGASTPIGISGPGRGADPAPAALGPADMGAAPGIVPPTRLAMFMAEVAALQTAAASESPTARLASEAAPLAHPSLSALSGHVLDRPTRFAMADGGTGEAGEAGEEAILPLRDGGVRAVAEDGRETILRLARLPGGTLGVAAPARLPILDRPPVAFARGGLVSAGRAVEIGADMPSPSGRDGGGGAAPVTVNVINNAGQVVQARQEERPAAGGGRIVDVMIEQIDAALSERIASGRGMLPDALAGTYGLGRAVR